MDNFKGNSNAGKKLSTVTTNVKVKKQSELSKFGKQFFAEDGKSVKSHIFSNVIIPGLQKLFTDIVINGVNWLTYGKKSGGSTRSGVRNISYSNFYERNKSSGFSDSRSTSLSKPGAYSVNEVIFPDRGDAEEVLLKMKEACERYGMVSVADFYDTINEKHSFTDNKWGWTDLSNVEVVRNRDGFSINFPKSKPIE